MGEAHPRLGGDVTASAHCHPLGPAPQSRFGSLIRWEMR